MIYDMNFKALRQGRALSEEALASKAGVSRVTVRGIESGSANPTVLSLKRLASALGRALVVMTVPSDREVASEVSTIAVALNTLKDGYDSWPLHFMELVDEYRKNRDPRLLLLPPHRQLELKLKALLASIVCQLCEESGDEPPKWASRLYFLPSPWFVSEAQSLKAFAILESPLAFRRNNIFVTSNFLSRV